MEAEEFLLAPSGWVPNNAALPVMVYRGVLGADAGDLAAAFEECFARNAWPPQWRDGVYRFVHYHSTAHEAMGFAAGTALLRLGGDSGKEIELHAGDALMLPAGTGHQRVRASRDLLVVGAYPPGQVWDTCRGPLDEAAQHRLRHLPFPRSDPILGPDGPLVHRWTSGALA